MRDASGRYGNVLLLGGTSEIGQAILRRLPLAHDARVTLAGRDPQALAAMAGPAGVRLQAEQFDALDPVGHPGFVARVLAGGDLDLLVVASGVLHGRSEDPAQAALEVLTTNLAGLVSVLTPLAQAMRAQRHGTIVVLSSFAAVRPRKANYLYGASKAGLDAFAAGLGDDLHGQGVQVMVVRPGFVRGRMTRDLLVPPLSSTPDGVADAVRRGLRAGRSVVYVPARLGLLAAVLPLVPRAIWRRLDI